MIGQMHRQVQHAAAHLQLRSCSLRPCVRGPVRNNVLSKLHATQPGRDSLPKQANECHEHVFDTAQNFLQLLRKRQHGEGWRLLLLSRAEGSNYSATALGCVLGNWYS